MDFINYVHPNDDNNNNEWKYSEEDIAHKFFFFNVLKDGRIHMLIPQTSPGFKIIPPSDDPTTGVKIKDVAISSDVSARVFLPPNACASNKVPVVYYVHGGGFCICSTFSVAYTVLLTRLAAECNVVVVSVEYGLFPARLIPACYEDAWVGLKWLASHADPSVSGESTNFHTGSPDPWISDYADLKQIFVGGDSAGANISHNLMTRVGKTGLPGGAKVEGMILVHPYFGEGDKMWMYMCPTNEGPQDPRMKPTGEDLARIGCGRVLVLVAEKDFLKEEGEKYVEELKKSGWKGEVELVVNQEKHHCFHIINRQDPDIASVDNLIKSFIYHNKLA